MKKLSFLTLILFITLSIHANTCVENILSNKHVYMYMKTTPIENGLPEPISREIVESELRKVIHNSFDEDLKVHNVVVAAKPNSRMLIEWWSIYDDACNYPVEIFYQYIHQNADSLTQNTLNPILDGLSGQVIARVMTGKIHSRHYEETLKIVKDFGATPITYITKCPKFKKNIDILPYFKRVIVRGDIEAVLSFDVDEGIINSINIKESNYDNSNLDYALEKYLIDTAITESNMIAFDCKLKIKFDY